MLVKRKYGGGGSPAWVIRKRIRNVVVAIIVVFVGVGVFQLILTIVRDHAIHWGVIGTYLVSDQIFDGIKVTLLLTVVSQAIGIMLGTLLAIFRISQRGPWRAIAAVYLWLFRGIPTLVQLIMWYNLALFFKTMSFGIPFGPTLFRSPTQDVITATGAAILGLGLTEAGFMAEIIRSSIQSVEIGQIEAGKALGMTPWQTLRRIVLPQAFPVAIPPTGNQVINMLKLTSLVSVIGAEDLLTRAEYISAQNFQVLELLIVAAIWYLVMTNIAMLAEKWLERKVARMYKGRVPESAKEITEASLEPV